jgi:hypothetical protein
MPSEVIIPGAAFAERLMGRFFAGIWAENLKEVTPGVCHLA